MYSEEQAKTKWCPMVNISYPYPEQFHATNRQDVDGTNNFLSRPFCIAFDCMMWRWGNKQQGYCGLAGEPK